jgi:hypothetical protein
LSVLFIKANSNLTGTGAGMDLFGKQARQELEQLQLKMRNLESRYNCMAEMHSKVSVELQESTALVEPPALRVVMTFSN